MRLVSLPLALCHSHECVLEVCWRLGTRQISCLRVAPVCVLLLHQVVCISSAASASYRSMLSHLSCAPLVGLDTEGAMIRRDKIAVVLALMAPAAQQQQDEGLEEEQGQ